jgi:hypothetical protein
MENELRFDESRRIVKELNARPRDQDVFILLDDPIPERTQALFGRLRDELWQAGILWIVTGEITRRHELTRPPADAFFEKILELAPLNQAQQLELVRRRLESDDQTDLLGVTVETGNPRTLLTVLRDALAEGADVRDVLSERAERQMQADKIGRLESMMFAEIEDGATASASDPEWLQRFGVSRQRAQQVLARLETARLVRAQEHRGPNGRPRRVYRRVTSDG